MSEIRADKLHNASGDNDSGIDLSTNDQVSIKTADTTRVLVDASGNVGIGTASPSEQVNLVGSSGTSKIRFDGDSSNLQNNFIGITGYDDLIIASDEANSGSASTIQFRVDGSERMRVDSSGNLLINNTGASPLDSGRVRIYNNTAQDALKTYQATSGTTCLWNRIDHTASFFAVFRISTTTVGTINTNGSSTSYNTSSDYRLKENVVEMSDATTRLKQLQPKRFNFIADADTTVDGFLAHEVQTIVPEAITGEKDAVDDDGNIIPQGIDQSKIVPLLVKTIQELEARITALENAE